MPPGSSPRVWGILHGQVLDLVGVRFIPTRVGNTSSTWWPCCMTAVHPHACGEYSTRGSSLMQEIGSSPRVWGIPSGKKRNRPFARFIPTRVGNTRPCAGSGRPYPVHPHACGEYPANTHGVLHGIGSSPRVWGILFRKMQEITDCWQSSSVLPSHACCKPAPMTIKRGRSFVKRLLPLVKNCPAGQSRSLDVTCPDRRNARLRS